MALHAKLFYLIKEDLILVVVLDIIVEPNIMALAVLLILELCTVFLMFQLVKLAGQMYNVVEIQMVKLVVNHGHQQVPNQKLLLA